MSMLHLGYGYRAQIHSSLYRSFASTYQTADTWGQLSWLDLSAFSSFQANGWLVSQKRTRPPPSTSLRTHNKYFGSQQILLKLLQLRCCGKWRINEETHTIVSAECNYTGQIDRAVEEYAEQKCSQNLVTEAGREREQACIIGNLQSIENKRATKSCINNKEANSPKIEFQTC
jgi:hypothetical protein